MILCVFNLTIGTVVWMYTAEILDAKGNGLAAAFHLLTAFLVGLFFPVGLKYLGIYSIFFIFSGLLILGMSYLFKNVKEIKGLSKEEIYNLFYDVEENNGENK